MLTYVEPYVFIKDISFLVSEYCGLWRFLLMTALNNN